MAYAVVVDPGAVDSTDEPSYQTHVRGKIESAAKSKWGTSHERSYMRAEGGGFGIVSNWEMDLRNHWR